MRRFVALKLTLLASFAALALYARGPTSAFDQRVSDALQSLDAPWFYAAMGWITHLGNAPVLVPAVLLTVILLSARKLPRAAIIVLLLGVTDFVVDGVLKAIFERDRPFNGLLTMRSWSFPSGHALSVTAVWGILFAASMQAFGWTPRARRWGWTGYVALVLAVGLSRIALGVHWPSDVAAGFAVGGILLGLGILALRRWVDPAP